MIGTPPPRSPPHPPFSILYFAFFTIISAYSSKNLLKTSFSVFSLIAPCLLLSQSLTRQPLLEDTL